MFPTSHVVCIQGHHHGMKVVYMLWSQRADSAHNSTPGDNDSETLLSVPWAGPVLKHKYIYDGPPVIFVHENKPRANISSADIA